MAKRILVLGGGTGGTIVANNLAHKLRGELARGSVEVTVIDQSPLHMYQPAYLLIPFGIMNMSEAVRSERELLSERVKFVQDTVVSVDLNDRRVSTTRGDINYDYLVIATGAQPDYSQVPGLREAGHDFYTLDNTRRLREALGRFSGGRVVTAVAGIPFKCPTAPLEFVFLADSYFRRLGVRDKVQLDYVYPLPRPFTIANVAEQAQSMLDGKGISTTLMFNLESVDPEKKELSSMEGEKIKYDLAVLVPPHTGAEVLRKSGLTDGGGWVPTDRYTLKVKGHDDAFAIGDTTDLPVSKAGSAADFQAAVVASNISDEISGFSPSLRYDGRVMCFIITSIGEATMLIFDYDHPPHPPPSTFACYWYKLAYNRMYWTVTAKAMLPGFGV